MQDKVCEMIKKEESIASEKKRTLKPLPVFENNNVAFEPTAHKVSLFRERSYCSLPLEAKPSLAAREKLEIKVEPLQVLTLDADRDKDKAHCCSWLSTKWQNLFAARKTTPKRIKLSKSQGSTLRRTNSIQSLHANCKINVDGNIFPRWTTFKEVCSLIYFLSY